MACTTEKKEREVIKLSCEIAADFEKDDKEILGLMERADLSSKASEEWKQGGQEQKDMFNKIVDKAKGCNLFSK